MSDSQHLVELDAAEMAETSGGGLWSWLFGEPATGFGGGSSGGGGASGSW
jgi:uncharacterized membrane protein YgcG